MSAWIQCRLLTRSKSVMVVFAARCFRLFLSNAGTRAVCQKLTYIGKEPDKER